MIALTTDSSRKERVFQTLEGKRGDRLARAFNAFFIALICLNVLGVILETDPALREPNRILFYLFLLFSTVAFTVDYVLRLWSCTVDTRFQTPIWGRLRYAITPLALIDLITVAAFYLSLFIQDRPVVRVLRLLIVLRIFQLGRYHSSYDILTKVLIKKRWELVAIGIIGMTLLIIMSTLLYLVEGPAQPDKFGTIPSAMWWGALTLSTVGSGDVYPVTDLGKVLAGLTAFLGIAFIAFPTAILGSAFYEEIQVRKYQPNEHSTAETLAAPQSRPSSPLDELAKLATLRDQGVVTAQEFQEYKKKLLGR